MMHKSLMGRGVPVTPGFDRYEWQKEPLATLGPTRPDKAPVGPPRPLPRGSTQWATINGVEYLVQILRNAPECGVPSEAFLKGESPQSHWPWRIKDV